MGLISALPTLVSHGNSIVEVAHDPSAQQSKSSIYPAIRPSII